MRGDRGQRGRPPTGKQQKPGADRPVEPRQPQVRTQPGRGDCVDPIAGRVGDRTGRPGHLLSGLPVSESNVPYPPVLVLVAESTVGVLMASLSDGVFGWG